MKNIHGFVFSHLEATPSVTKLAVVVSEQMQRECAQKGAKKLSGPLPKLVWRQCELIQKIPLLFALYKGIIHNNIPDIWGL